MHPCHLCLIFFPQGFKGRPGDPGKPVSERALKSSTMQLSQSGFPRMFWNLESKAALDLSSNGAAIQLARYKT